MAPGMPKAKVMRHTAFVMPPKLREQLAAAAAKHGCGLSHEIRERLERSLVPDYGVPDPLEVALDAMTFEQAFEVICAIVRANNYAVMAPCVQKWTVKHAAKIAHGMLNDGLPPSPIWTTRYQNALNEIADFSYSRPKKRCKPCERSRGKPLARCNGCVR